MAQEKEYIGKRRNTMRSGLWMLAFVASTHSSVEITGEGSIALLLVVAIFVMLDIAEYVKKF